MNKFRKCGLLVIILAVMISGCALGGKKMIGKDAALQAALTDAGLTADQAVDIDIELERDLRSAWYEIDFECGRTEYEYKVNAYSGEILSARTD